MTPLFLHPARLKYLAENFAAHIRFAGFGVRHHTPGGGEDLNAKAVVETGQILNFWFGSQRKTQKDTPTAD